jgi:membrane protease YdiL (CAAX protease family)
LRRPRSTVEAIRRLIEHGAGGGEDEATQTCKMKLRDNWMMRLGQIVVALAIGCVVFWLIVASAGLLGILREASRYGAVVGPIALTLLGLAMALTVNRDRLPQRVLWIAAFASLGTLSVCATFLNQERLSIEAMGGDNFCAVSFLYDPGSGPQGEISPRRLQFR